jgi:sec-independent protein translocase protein TatA
MSIGVWQVVLILAIVLIIFGAGKLPRVMGDLAKGIKTFKAGMREEIEEEKSQPAAQERIAEGGVAKPGPQAQATAAKDEVGRG